MTPLSILMSLINSEHPDDIARARAECAARGIDYAAARDAKLREMIAEGRALMARQDSGESRAEKFRGATGRER